MFANPGDDNLVVIGCNKGVDFEDFEVNHVGSAVVLKTEDGRAFSFTTGIWAKAVYDFADAVRTFYTESSTPASGDLVSRRGVTLHFCALLIGSACISADIYPAKIPNVCAPQARRQRASCG
jgi:hypothetical protein